MKPISTLTHLNWETIQAYLAGKLNRSENHAVEEHLLDCEMCADAVEGLSKTPPAQTDQVIKKTGQQIDKKVQKKKKRGALRAFYPYWAIAASLVLVLGIVLILLLKMPTKKENLAEKAAIKEEKAAGNATPTPLEESESLAEKTEQQEKAKNSTKKAIIPPKNTEEKPNVTTEENQEPILDTENTQNKKGEGVSEGAKITEDKTTNDKTESQTTDVQVVQKQENEKLSSPVQDDLLKEQKVKETELAKKRAKQDVQTEKQDLTVLDTLQVELPKKEIKRMEIPTEIIALKPDFRTLLDSLKIDFSKVEYQYVPLPVPVLETLALKDENTEEANKTDQDVKTEDKQKVEEVQPVPSEIQKTEPQAEKNIPKEEKAEKKLETEAAKVDKKEEVVEPEPELPANSSVYPEGGWDKFQEYVKTNLRYPEDAKRDQIQGMVRLEVIIGADGKVKEVEVKRGLIESCNAEAVRLVRMYKWFAARQDGRPVEESITIKINFE